LRERFKGSWLKLISTCFDCFIQFQPTTKIDGLATIAWWCSIQGVLTGGKERKIEECVPERQERFEGKKRTGTEALKEELTWWRRPACESSRTVTRLCVCERLYEGGRDREWRGKERKRDKIKRGGRWEDIEWISVLLLLLTLLIRYSQSTWVVRGRSWSKAKDRSRWFHTLLTFFHYIVQIEHSKRKVVQPPRAKLDRSQSSEYGQWLHARIRRRDILRRRKTNRRRKAKTFPFFRNSFPPSSPDSPREFCSVE